MLESKIFMDYDKTNSMFYINYFIEDTKALIKFPMKRVNDNNEENCIISNKFDFSNKIYLIDIN